MVQMARVTIPSQVETELRRTENQKYDRDSVIAVIANAKKKKKITIGINITLLYFA